MTAVLSFLQLCFVMLTAQSLVGGWESAQSFGHAIGGGRLRVMFAPQPTAVIAGQRAVAMPSGNASERFAFSDGSSLVVRLDTQASSIVAEWTQPATIADGERFVSPVVLAKGADGAWSGVVAPVPDVLHFYLRVTQNPDGTTGAFFRNPETNAGARIGTRTLTVHGAAVVFHADGAPDITGAYDAVERTLTFSFEGLLKPFVFHKVDPSTTVGFTPRPGAAPYVYQVPAQLDDGWRTASLADVGLNTQRIAAFIDAMVKTPVTSGRAPYIHSVSIARHGKLVLDEYFYGFDARTLHDVRSAGKSVTTLMVGDAMRDDPALRPETPISAVLPQYAADFTGDPRKASINVADLMTMSSGLACDDNDDQSPGNEGTMQGQTAQPDWYKYTLDLPIASDPGTKAAYCSAGINLLGAVIASATHAWLPDDFYDRFARPMQFGPYALPETPPPLDTAYMAGGGRFLPRDFLKFGQLMLDDGVWNGTRVVEKEWVDAVTVPRSALNAPGDYGYGWHLSTFTVGGVSYPAFNAGGNGGQLLFVIPKLDMTVMITAGNYGQYPVWRSFQTEPFVDYLIPAATAR